MSFSIVRRRRYRHARSVGALLPVVLIAACSRTLVFGGGDSYANCADLGDLALASDNRADAEQRMRAQVLELGGDTLLFGERGRSVSVGDVPEEIVERRNQLVSPVSDEGTVSPEGAAESPAGPSAESAERHEALSQPVDRGRGRRGRISMEAMAVAPGQLWYYGAALRCNR